MPSIAPYTIHAASPGVRLADVGLRGDEDFLLVHSVSDSADYGNRITRFNAAGDRIYDAIQDPTLTFSFDADCLAFEGLANAHPGQAVLASDILNLIPDAFQWEGVNRKYIYMRPRRVRRSAQLASINFDIEVVNETISTQYSFANNKLDAANWDVAAVYSNGAAVPFAGYSIIWSRELIPAMTDAGDNNTEANTTRVYQGWPAASPQPANYTEFRALVDSYGVDPGGVTADGKSEIIEVYKITGLTGPSQWYLKSEQTPLIAGLINERKNPIDEAVVDGIISAKYYALWHIVTDNSDVNTAATYMNEEFNDLQDFLNQVNDGLIDNAARKLLYLYDARKCAKLYPPS